MRTSFRCAALLVLALLLPNAAPAATSANWQQGLVKAKIYVGACPGQADAGGNSLGIPISDSFTSTASQAVQVAGANPNRVRITFAVPSTLTGGLWINPIGAASANGTDSMLLAAGSTITFDGATIGTGAISGYATTGSVNVTVWEC